MVCAAHGAKLIPSEKRSMLRCDARRGTGLIGSAEE